jgi:beta-lactamase class D
MRPRKFIFLLALILAACSPSQPTEISHPEWGSIFENAGIAGGIIVFDYQANTYHVNNPDRLDTPYLPASTFKILNSLIALESGVVTRDEVIPWDGRNWEVTAWNQDHTIDTAIANSAVWFYQELARRAGHATIQDFVNRAEYGNQNINGQLDSFWLDGELRITARQQIDFLVNFYEGNLPFSEDTLNIVKEITIVEETDDYVIHAKTGWAQRTEPNIGWWVGWVEKGDNVYFFAINIYIVNPETDPDMRFTITKEALRNLQILD